MSRLPIFFRWLIVAAAADWLIARTIARLAIFMPKSPAVLAVYQALGVVGQIAATLAGLLAIGGLAWIAGREWRNRVSGAVLSAAVLGVTALGLVSLVRAATDWLAVAGHLFTLTAAVSIAWFALRESDDKRRRIAVLLPVVAFLFGALYQLGPAVYQALRWPGPPPFSNALFMIGELFVVFSPIGLWWARRPADGRRVLAAAAIPALAFAAMYLASPATSGILSIWSVGLTLYLPWPLYAASLWLAGAVVIDSLRRGDRVGWAVVLLAAGGYAPQLSTQVAYGLIALWLLARRHAQAEPYVRGVLRKSAHTAKAL